MYHALRRNLGLTQDMSIELGYTTAHTFFLLLGWKTSLPEQVRRKYSYSAVGSSVRVRETETGNTGISSRLKNMQKERLLVARLGFPDQAMEIDGHIEKIRADLRVSYKINISEFCNFFGTTPMFMRTNHLVLVWAYCRSNPFLGKINSNLGVIRTCLQYVQCTSERVHGVYVVVGHAC